MAKLAPIFNDAQFINGIPASGAKLFTYAAGSSTKQTTYTDEDGTTPQANPIILNSRGEPDSPIWLTEGQAYKFVLAPPTDSDPPTSPIRTVDDITGVGDNSVSLDQWVDSGVTPTYVSATQFTVPGDQTSAFHANRRIKCTVTAGTVYGYISASAYTSLTTITVVLDSGSLDSGLSQVQLGLVTANNTSLPQIPDWVESGMIQDEAITPDKLSDDAFIAIVGDFKNLIITNNTATPNSQVDIDADEIVLKDSDGRAYLASAVNLTVNIAASGANGLDTGSEAISTWYYLWVIYDGTTVAGLLSTSSTAPTLPSGYTYKALMGAIYNDGSSNFIKILQHGNRVNSVWATVTSTIPTASYVSISLAAYVPSNARSVLGTVYGVASSSNTLAGYHAPSGADDLAIISRWFAGSGSSSGGSFEIQVPIITAQTIYYKRGSTAFSAYEFNAHGWTY